MRRLYTITIAASLLTGLWLTGTEASEQKDVNCPPPPGSPRGWGPPMMGGGPGGPGPHRLTPPFADADFNKDGRITHAEIDQSTKARFEAADVDRNGALDAKEFESARPQPPADRPRPPEGVIPPGRFGGGPEHMFKRLDWNGDGKLSRDEFESPVRAIASRIDRDADGAITEDEIKGPPPPHGPPPPPE